MAILQVGRAFAALLVVLFHVTLSIYEAPNYGHPAPFGGFFAFGHAGVEFFFVLSGFVILHVHRSDIGCPGHMATYAWKRIRRIYPLYWVVLLPVIGAYLAVPSFGKPAFHRPDVILSSILLVHFRTDIVILYVAWTLYHEVLFYAVFALLILDQRTGIIALVAWLLASLVALATQAHSSWVFWCSPLNLLFAMGMGVAWRMRRGRLPFAASIAAGGALLFVSVGIDEVYLGALSRGVGSMLYGLGAAAALAGLVSLEQAGHIRTPSALRLIGDASYSIYLVHLPVLSLLAKSDLQMYVAAAVTPTVSFVLMTVLAVAPGLGVHLWVERPLLRLLSVRTRTPAVAVAT